MSSERDPTDTTEGGTIPELQRQHSPYEGQGVGVVQSINPESTDELKEHVVKLHYQRAEKEKPTFGGHLPSPDIKPMSSKEAEAQLELEEKRKAMGQQQAC